MFENKIRSPLIFRFAGFVLAAYGLVGIFILLWLFVTTPAPSPISGCSPQAHIDLPQVLPNPETSFSTQEGGTTTPYEDMVATPSLPVAVRMTFDKSFVGIASHVVGSKVQWNGTGFVARSMEGLGVVTSFHVVADIVCEPPQWKYKISDKPQVITVQTGKEAFPANIVRYDEEKDLVLLRVSGSGPKKEPVSVGNVTAGPLFGFGIGSNSGATGIESAKAVTFLRVLRYYHPTASGPEFGVLSGWARYGFSGSCVIDIDGRCVGVLRALGGRPETVFLPAASLTKFLEWK